MIGNGKSKNEETSASQEYRGDSGETLDYELFILIFISFSLLIAGAILLLPLSQAASEALMFINLVISVILLIDYFLMIARMKQRFSFFIRGGWLVLLGCLPFYPLMRFLLLIRMVVIIRRLQQYGSHPIIDRIVERRAENALRFAGFIIILVLTLGSILVLQFESASPNANILTGVEALWWSVVTVATVGYGDYYPVTNNGRFVGVAIMIVGVGMFGVLSSYLAKTFLSPTKKETADKDLQDREKLVKAVRQETEALREEMASLRGELAEVRQLLGQKQHPES